MKYSSNSICSSVLFCWLLFIEEFEKLSHEMTSSSSSDFISQMSICSTWIFYAFFSSSAFKRLVKLLLGVLCDLQKYILEGLEVLNGVGTSPRSMAHCQLSNELLSPLSTWVLAFSSSLFGPAAMRSFFVGVRMFRYPHSCNSKL